MGRALRLGPGVWGYVLWDVEGDSYRRRFFHLQIILYVMCPIHLGLDADALRVAEKKEKDMSARLLIVMSNLLSPHSIFIQPAEKRSIG